MVKNRLDVPIIVQKIRIHPIVDDNSPEISLQVELQGCGKGGATTTTVMDTTTMYEVETTTQVIEKTTKPVATTPGINLKT